MMYKLVHALLYLLSLLPLRVLYLLSDFFYFIIYRVAGYRKKVVLANLDIAFPEKPADEKKEIAKRFYKNFMTTSLKHSNCCRAAAASRQSISKPTLR